jgi:dolichyl-phosphate-mannose-protein mannosyltransferase
MKYSKAKIFLAILIALSFCTHFIFFGYPSQAVFDEVYFGNYAANYISGNFFFDVHPPLGKLLLAFMGELSPHKPQEYMFHNIGEQYPDNSYIFLRFLPMLTGALLPIIIFLLCKELKFRDETAFLAGLLLIFDTSLLVESRFILIDNFILFFGFLGLLGYLKYRRTRNQIMFWSSIVLLAAAVCVKWTGLTFLGLAGLLELRDLIRSYRSTRYIRVWLYEGLAFIIVPIFIYISIFTLHIYLLPKSGPGDAFMSPNFQKTLLSNSYEHDISIKPSGFTEKFKELHKVMVGVQNQEQFFTHPYMSVWYTWPLTLRSIYYWNDPHGAGKIYLLGNPAVYWASALAVLILLVQVLVQLGKYLLQLIKKVNRKNISISFTAGFLLIGYLANFLPFIFITRGMFLYHYLSALVFACLITTYLIDKIENKKYRNNILMIIGVLAFIGFIYFAPLAYGIPISSKAFNAHMWLKSWI